MEIKQNELDKVAGGKIIKGEDGAYYITPDWLPACNTKENASELESLLDKNLQACPLPQRQATRFSELIIQMDKFSKSLNKNGNDKIKTENTNK